MNGKIHSMCPIEMEGWSSVIATTVRAPPGSITTCSLVCLSHFNPPSFLFLHHLIHPLLHQNSCIKECYTTTISTLSDIRLHKTFPLLLIINIESHSFECGLSICGGYTHLHCLLQIVRDFCKTGTPNKFLFA